jgi:hypothetical protein
MIHVEHLVCGTLHLLSLVWKRISTQVSTMLIPIIQVCAFQIDSVEW